ncbi:hairy/enhancer-of-split related with YRPW motif protein 1-like [Actinia tenebrosa]|uniref:Hairy/enhancer-of-split related with YRPW motif protein 1-like n=1 Tax=Actinia tenebrosa TaxID=6105 RepID=A0A6P8HRK9_ACTTE|nr:hairy/enhancer-of-split related with YRPW motif protein 1-like [Actinia tenebrosa]
MHLGMKRAYSESEDEEGYSWERCLEGEDDETTARKRRRGLIEKKRRDRINSCLTELRRLVPAAVDKQGSTKLEKAEILQLTVEHLKSVRKLAKRETASIEGADYRAAGFRECFFQVSRYLQGFRDPNCKEDQKAHLLSHLNTIISHGVCQSRPPMASSVVWPRGVSSQVTYHDTTTVHPLATAKIRTGKPLANTLHENVVVNKDKSTLIKNQNMLIRPAVPDLGARSVEPNRYSFTMYPPTAHCTRNDNLMIRFPFVQREDDVLKSAEQIMFGAANTKTIGPDHSMIQSLFCQGPF